MKIYPHMLELTDHKGVKASFDPSYIVSVTTHHAEPSEPLNLPQRFMLNVRLFHPGNEMNRRYSQNDPVQITLVYLNDMSCQQHYDKVLQARQKAIEWLDLK